MCDESRRGPVPAVADVQFVDTQAPGAAWRVSRPQVRSGRAPSGPLTLRQLQGTVLAAEDTGDLRELAVLYLKSFGLSALEAVNGEEAVEVALRQRPHAVLMDLEMPVLGGLDAVKQLRERGYGGAIFAMTGHLDAGMHVQARAAGCNEVLTKPVSRAQLHAALERVLGVAASSPVSAMSAHLSPDPHPVAEVSRDLAELIPLFMSTRAENLAGLTAGLKAGNFKALEIIGHSMKGAGSSYGFVPVSEIGASIETAARARDGAAISLQQTRLRDYLANLQIRYV